MTKDVALLPCPFCGSTDLDLAHKADPSPESYPEGVFVIECGGCGALGPFCEERPNAPLAWNDRRSVEPAGDPLALAIVEEVIRQHPQIECKGGNCPETMWCEQEAECLWTRWNK